MGYFHISFFVFLKVSLLFSCCHKWRYGWGRWEGERGIPHTCLTIGCIRAKFCTNPHVMEVTQYRHTHCKKCTGNMRWCSLVSCILRQVFDLIYNRPSKTLRWPDDYWKVMKAHLGLCFWCYIYRTSENRSWTGQDQLYWI